MYCPNCKQEYDGKFCPECGTTVNKHTNVAAQKTESEILQERKIELYGNSSKRVYDDGILEKMRRCNCLRKNDCV